MKKLMLLLVIALLCSVLSGCKSGGEESSSPPESSETSTEQPEEIPTVNIMLDLVRSRPSSNQVSNLLYSIPGYGTEFSALTESSPFDFQERDAFMTRVKTEIMAGKGPDVFICENPYTSEIGQGLFPFPQKAMKNHLLLPLDDYIENAEYMDPDKLLPVIMEAGKNEEGQQILPVAFNFSVTAYSKELFTLEEELPLTWDEAITSGDPMVRYAATTGDYRDIFGVIADLDNDKMAVEEEDIALRMEQVWNLNREEFTMFSENDGETARLEMNSEWLKHDFSLGGKDEYWLVPKYNTEGGVTANVEAFAAVNRNTKLPKESFKVLDMLMSYRGQKSSFVGALTGMPVHMDVGLDGQNGPGWTMNEWNAEQYKALLGQINAVRYTTPVEQEFFEIYPDHFNNGGEWSDIAHRHYMKMQMMLAES